MTILRVWAHWTDGPAGSTTHAPAPASLTTNPSGPPYPGVIPLISYPPPSWSSSKSGPVASGDVYRVWAELASQADINAAQWGGAGTWAGSPPPSWPNITGTPGNGDEGYSGNAADFSVNRVGIFLDANPGNNHEFRIFGPGGNLVTTIHPQGPGVTWDSVNVVSGRGIWTVEIDRPIGSSVVEPSLFGTAATPPHNQVEEPFVSPYGSPYEGVLGILFDGVEVPVQVCPTSVVLSAELDDGSGTYHAINNGDCIPVGASVRYTATVAPAGTQNHFYIFTMGDGTIRTTLSPINSVIHSYTSPDATLPVSVQVQTTGCPNLNDTLNLSTGCCVPSGSPEQYWDAALQQCRTCPVSLSASATAPSGCAPGQHGVAQLTATPGANIQVASYTWTIDGPTNHPSPIHVSRTSSGMGNSPTTVDTSTGWSGNGASAGQVQFPDDGTYSISVTGSLSGDLATCNPVQGSAAFTVASCCPPGQVWNPDTGLCEPGDCPPGQVRDPQTGICKPVDCPPGQVRNPNTGQCEPEECPPGQVRDPQTGLCKPQDCPPGQVRDPKTGICKEEPGGGFSLCCILLGVWMLLFLVLATLLYFSVWKAALVVGIVFLIALALWILICCWPCARRFWRCCTLLQWFFIVTVLTTSALFALFAIFQTGGWVVFGYGLFAILIGILLGAAGCRAPNPYWPPDWPPCTCPGRGRCSPGTSE